jgi:cobalamin biosynthesis Mg chelatase CobN
VTGPSSSGPKDPRNKNREAELGGADALPDTSQAAGGADASERRKTPRNEPSGAGAKPAGGMPKIAWIVGVVIIIALLIIFFIR